MRLSGYIRKYLSDKAYGFIAECNTQNEHFFHITSCKHVPEIGQRVLFEVGVGRRGPAAVNIELAEPSVAASRLAANTSTTEVSK